MSYYLFCFQLNDFILFVIIWTIVSEFCLLERPGQPVKYIREGYKKRVSQKNKKTKKTLFRYFSIWLNIYNYYVELLKIKGLTFHSAKRSFEG